MFTTNAENGIVGAQAYLDGTLAATALGHSSYLDVDFTGAADGAHTICIKVWDATHQEATTCVSVSINPALLRQKALKFLRSLGSTAIRFADLPIRIAVSTEFSEGYFSLIQVAANFWSRYTVISFIIERENIDLSNCSPPDGLEKKIYIRPVKPCSSDDIALTYRSVSSGGEILWALINVVPMPITNLGNQSFRDEFAGVIAHEIGHATAIYKHTNDGSLMDP